MCFIKHHILKNMRRNWGQWSVWRSGHFNSLSHCPQRA